LGGGGNSILQMSILIVKDLLSYRFEAKFNLSQESFGVIRSNSTDNSSEEEGGGGGGAGDESSSQNLITCYNEENENEIKIWDLKSNTVCMSLTGHTGRLNCSCVYKLTKLISGGNDSLIKIWSLKSGVCLSTLTGHTNTVRSLKVIKGDMLISG
jgi:WD40 repeat protein